MLQSHKEPIWQLSHHPSDNILFSVSSDASVKLWRAFDKLGDAQNEQWTNSCLLGSLIEKRQSGMQEIPTCADWVRSSPNMVAVAYRSPLISIFDRVTGRSKGSLRL